MNGYIDVHHHVRTAAMAEAAAVAGLNLGAGSRGGWEPETALSAMDATGIAATVLSPIIFVASIPDGALAAPVHRVTNDFLASVVARFPARFGAFAAIPIGDPALAIAEMARALDTLQLDGILLPSGIGSDLIGAERFDPVLAELDRRGATVHLHPTNPPNPVPGYSSSTPVDFPVETTRAIASLLVSGALERYPNIRWIMAHGGGAFPYIAGRVARSDSSPGLRENAPLGTAAYMRRVYYDIAVCCHPNALPSLLTVTSASHIIFGTDMPAFSNDEVTGSIHALENDFGLSEEALRGIRQENAKPLFPRLAAAMAAL